MKFKRQKFASYFFGAVTVIAAIVFTDTLVRAAIYDPGATGSLPAVYSPAIVQAAASQSEKVASSTRVAASPAAKPATYPSRLLIPSLHINANVQDLGINTKGNIGTPDNFTDVGWYSYGTVPGQPGVAVIDGHVDNGLGLDGVFKHLSDIQTGDEVDIVTYGGKTLRFIVTSTELYDYENVPPQAIFGTDSASSSAVSLLRLITCDGAWVSGGDTYNERLIVTAALVSH